MSKERVFGIDGIKATPATPITLAAAGLLERRDLQEWVIAHPEILGDGVMVVGFEFDRWAANRSGDRERDRLDVLGLDTDGRLVVAELKRDRAPETVNLQAIKYAAMASRFSETTLVDLYVAMKQRAGTEVNEVEALEDLVAHAGELDPEQLRRPRIVLVAGSFPTTVTATAVWLSEMGLDIAIQQVQAYSVFDGRIVVTASQLYPVVDVEEFTISPQRAQVRAAEDRRKSGRERSTVLQLLKDKTLEDGAELRLVPTNEVDEPTREAIMEWVADEPSRGRARWFNRRSDPIEWEFDGSSSRPTPLVRAILLEAAGVERSPRGPAWWVTPEGVDLTTLAGRTRSRGSFDWSELHRLLERIPAGRWTSYGDLAALVGTAAQPLGQHITSCEECQNAHRVLNGNGSVNPNFSWSDPADERRPDLMLIDEGVLFDGDRAGEESRLTEAELEALGDES